jgi:hypothetical protein
LLDVIIIGRSGVAREQRAVANRSSRKLIVANNQAPRQANDLTSQSARCIVYELGTYRLANDSPSFTPASLQLGLGIYTSQRGGVFLACDHDPIYTRKSWVNQRLTNTPALTISNKDIFLRYSFFSEHRLLPSQESMYTVVIPSCHRIDSLLVLLRDISMQSLYPSEIFLILQSYPPDSVQRIRGQLTTLDLIKVTTIIEFDKPYGLANCRTLVLDRLHTPYFSFLDDDISISSDFFELSISYHNSNPNILACSGFLTSVTTYPLLSIILNRLLPYNDNRRFCFSRLSSHEKGRGFEYTDVLSGGLTVWKTSFVQSSLPLPSLYSKLHYFEDVFFSLYFRRVNPHMSYAILSHLPASHADQALDRPSLAKALSLASELASLIKYFYPRLTAYVPLIYAFYILACSFAFMRRSNKHIPSNLVIQ